MMKKNAMTATQRRNIRKHAGDGAKWSPIWSADYGLPYKSRHRAAALLRGLHRSQPVPGWQWTHENASRAFRRRVGNPHAQFRREIGYGSGFTYSHKREQS